MKKAKTKTNRIQAHTSKSAKGLGDYYGTGIRAKLGRLREGTGMKFMSASQLKKPPKSVV
jgi:hypothetical protein